MIYTNMYIYIYTYMLYDIYTSTHTYYIYIYINVFENKKVYDKRASLIASLFFPA